MQRVIFDNSILEDVKKTSVNRLVEVMGDDLVKIVLFGSCARGNFNDDSDVDIAILTKSDRLEAKRYTDALAQLSTEIAMKNMAVVNFICIPYKEYLEKRDWYLFFKNI